MRDDCFACGGRTIQTLKSLRCNTKWNAQMSARRVRAFTLIEILTVVMILGILAALVVPSLTGFTSEATSSAAKSQLAAVRGQIEMYRLRNSGVVPAASGDDGTQMLWDAMTAVDGAHPPLLQRTPVLPREYSWDWDGRTLRVTYAGSDESVADEVTAW